MEYILFVVGLFTIMCTYFKPNFYWNSRKAMRARNSLGDKVTEKLYYGVGAFALILSLLEIFNVISLKL